MDDEPIVGERKWKVPSLLSGQHATVALCAVLDRERTRVPAGLRVTGIQHGPKGWGGGCLSARYGTHGLSY